MRIDSSSIGMGSTRRYSSVSGRVSRIVIANGRQSLTNQSGFLSGNLLGANVNQENAQTKGSINDLRDRLEEMRCLPESQKWEQNPDCRPRAP